MNFHCPHYPSNKVKPSAIVSFVIGKTLITSRGVAEIKHRWLALALTKLTTATENSNYLQITPQ